MRIWKYGQMLAVLAAFAWPMGGSIAFAQRDGAGEHGKQRGGGERSDSSQRGGGDHGGQRSANSSNKRSFSEKTHDSSNRNRSETPRSNQRSQASQGSAHRDQNRDADRGRESQRSFYRGDAEQPLQRDRSARDGGNRDGFDRNRSNQEFDHPDRDRSTWDRSVRDRADRDRSNSDRNDWDRFGRNDRRGQWDDIRRDWWRSYDRSNAPFRSGWWNSYYGAGWPNYSPYRYSRYSNQPYFWWGYTPATRLTDWLVFGWDRPRYWGYGPGANIYYRDDYVYYDNRRTIPVNDYYQQLYDLAHNVPNISESEAEQMDWSPLGVFAINRENGQESQRALQLAVNDSGVLSGTYFNRENGHVHPVSGMVDERTQRAAWAFADGEHEDVVFETALYNLTRQESTMMVHFGPWSSDTEVWQLVRLERPNSDDATSSARQQSTTTRTLP